MISKRHRPNARQVRWHQAVRALGCAWYPGQGYESICTMAPELHHCRGASFKHRKLWVGQDFVVPLCRRHHQGPGGIHSEPRRRELEARIWRWVLEQLEDCDDRPALETRLTIASLNMGAYA